MPIVVIHNLSTSYLVNKLAIISWELLSTGGLSNGTQPQAVDKQLQTAPIECERVERVGAKSTLKTMEHRSLHGI